MELNRRLKPLAALALLCITAVFLFFFTALPLYSTINEEYRRCAVELPEGPSIPWQEYEGYPFNWKAAVLTFISMSFFTVPLASIVAYTCRLFILMLLWLCGAPRRHHLFAKILYMIAGAGISLQICFSIFDHPNIEDWEGLPIRELGIVAAITFLVVPLWLPRLKSSTKADPKLSTISPIEQSAA